MHLSRDTGDQFCVPSCCTLEAQATKWLQAPELIPSDATPAPEGDYSLLYDEVVSWLAGRLYHQRSPDCP